MKVGMDEAFTGAVWDETAIWPGLIVRVREH